jgi:hypothetical protein
MKLAITAALMLAAVTMISGCDSKPKGPSAYSFAVQIDMTPAAADKMKASGDGLVVTAFYYGLAKPEFSSEADSAGRIRLGYEDPAFNGDARRVRLQAADIDESLFPKIVNNEVLALVTVASSSPQGNPDMAIYCRSAVVTAKQAQITVPVISCDVSGGV